MKKGRIAVPVVPVKYQNYEEKFEFPLYKLIKEKAEEKDISLVKAAEIVLPEYCKTIRYGDTEYEETTRQKQWDALDELVKAAGVKLLRQWEGEKDGKAV